MTRMWHDGCRSTRLDDLQPGDLVAIDYQPWSFIDLRMSDDGVPVVQVERNGKRTHFGIKTDRRWASLPKVINPEHYPVCSCGDLIPCRDEDMRRTIAQETATLNRYTTPGICPSCGEVITLRQKSMSWPNIILPGTPDVQFHLRWSCRREAMDYDRKCVAAGHGSRFDAAEAML